MNYDSSTWDYRMFIINEAQLIKQIFFHISIKSIFLFYFFLFLKKDSLWERRLPIIK